MVNVWRLAVYYTDWSCYREGLGKHSVKDIGPCNIALYSFAIMDPNTYKIIPADPQAAEAQYTNFVAHCVTTGRKPILALGGWVDSETDKYSKMMNDPNNRDTFVRSAVDYLTQNGFKGLNLDIEYPTSPQANNSIGNLNDKEGFTKLIQQLRKEFSAKNLEISAALPGSTTMIERGYDVKQLSDNLDWIGVMTYDYHTSGESKTGPISSISDTKTTVEYLIEKGARKDKLVIGIPFYGHSYKLKSSSDVGYGAKTEGKGDQGTYTKSPGFLAYYEISELITKKGYKEVNDSKGAYAYKGLNFISYNSKSDIADKINYAKERGLGGVMVWDSSMDDFTGHFCDDGRNPLLNWIVNLLL